MSEAPTGLKIIMFHTFCVEIVCFFICTTIFNNFGLRESIKTLKVFIFTLPLRQRRVEEVGDVPPQGIHIKFGIS